MHEVVAIEAAQVKELPWPPQQNTVFVFKRAGKLGEEKHPIEIILIHTLRWGYHLHFPGTCATDHLIASLSLSPVRPFERM